MSIRRSCPLKMAVVVTLGLCSLSMGCQSTNGFLGVDRGARIDKGAIPAPAGTHVCQWQQIQTGRAEQDDFVINTNEWSGDGQELGPDGRRHVQTIAGRIRTSPFPVLIAAGEDESLNQIRKQVIIDMLQERGVVDASQRTVIGYPEAEGLYGTEAARFGSMRMMGIGGMGMGGVGGMGGGGGGGGLGGGMGGFGGGSGGGMGMGIF